MRINGRLLLIVNTKMFVGKPRCHFLLNSQNRKNNKESSEKNNKFYAIGFSSQEIDKSSFDLTTALSFKFKVKT